MAFEKTYCANPHCRKHKEYIGGKFHFDSREKKYFCEDCFSIRAVFNDGKNLWDFTTTHFTGERVHVTSGKHLDQLCKQHGVSNHAREFNSNHW